MNDRLWELLAKRWAGRITPEEKAELEQLLLEHPDHWIRAGLMEQTEWVLHPELPNDRLDEMTDRITGEEEKRSFEEERMGRPVVRLIHHWKWIAAAILILCVSSVAVLFSIHSRTKDTAAWQKVMTTPGMKTTFRLPDGTEIWMNAGSMVKYPKSFGGKSREVCLSGEAYFKVKHDAGRPFIIHTPDMNIKVLGTEFDVRAYPDEDFAETSLIKGAVEVTVNNGRGSRQIFLKPKQKVVVEKVSSQVSVIKENQVEQDHETPLPVLTAVQDVKVEPVKEVSGNIIPETAWQQNTLLFEDETLESLAKRLDMWYGVNIVIQDSSLAKQRFTGRADNVSLDKLLKILQMIKPFQYKMNDKEVVIK